MCNACEENAIKQVLSMYVRSAGDMAELTPVVFFTSSTISTSFPTSTTSALQQKAHKSLKLEFALLQGLNKKVAPAGSVLMMGDMIANTTYATPWKAGCSDVVLSQTGHE